MRASFESFGETLRKELQDRSNGSRTKTAADTTNSSDKLDNESDSDLKAIQPAVLEANFFNDVIIDMENFSDTAI